MQGKWRLKRTEYTQRVSESSFIKQDEGGLSVPPTRGSSQGEVSEGPFQATSTRAKLWSMPRLFSTYTSYLPLSSGVARRIVSVVVVLPISKNTLGGKKGRTGPAVSLRAPWSGRANYPALFFASQIPRPHPTPSSFWTPPAQAPAPGAVLATSPAPPTPVVLIDVFPVLGPAHVGRRLAHDLGSQRYRGAFAHLSVTRSLLNLRRY